MQFVNNLVTIGMPALDEQTNLPRARHPSRPKPSNSGRLGVVNVANRISRSNAEIVSASASTAPLVETMTGSNTIGQDSSARLSATACAVSALPIIPILTASTPMSLTTAAIWSITICVGTMMHGIDAKRILRGNRGNRRHRMPAEHRHRLDISLNPRPAAAVGASDKDQDALIRAEAGNFCRRSSCRRHPAQASQMLSTIWRSTCSVRIVAFGHDSNDRLGARWPDDEATFAWADNEAPLRLRHWQSLPAPPHFPAACHPKSGHSSASCGTGSNKCSTSLAGFPLSTSCANTCNAAIVPSPVVAWSSMIICPDCSPPTLMPCRRISSST